MSSRVDLLRVAARVAGKPMTMMRDMGYNPQNLVYNVTEALFDAAPEDGGRRDFQKVHERVNEAMLRAWKAAGLPDTGSHIVEKRMGDDPRNVVHELEHRILDPEFDLEEGRSAKHSGVESVIEEVLSWGLAGGVQSDDGKYIVGDGAPEYLYPGAATVGEALDAIASAPVSSPERRKIRDSALHRLRTKFKGAEAASLDDVTPDEEVVYRWAMAHEFVDAVESKYDDWREIMTAELEEGWRKFNLHLKKEMRKLVPGVHSKSPRQVMEEAEAAKKAGAEG